MHILVTGGTGFIGSSLVPALVRSGHRVSVLSRSAQASLEEGADLITDIDQLSAAVEGVINLAGASLAGKRWNKDYKREIVESRLETTRSVAQGLKARGDVPRVWINASAIGYYGPRADEKLHENAAQGSGFAADLCRDWERLASEVVDDATRLCVIRLGVVLDRNGGAYEQMAQPFRMGIANWIGSGQQWLSWIHRADVVAAIAHLLDTDTAEGPFNLTAPEPVTSRGFCDAMKQEHKTLLTVPMPSMAMRLIVGEMADELLITGQRVVPTQLLASGFGFRYPSLEAALADINAAPRTGNTAA